MITLKRIENSKETDLISGISILQKYVPHNLCIDSNELIYWIDNYNKKFDDQMYCYVIKNGAGIIGWLQFTHFKDKFVFLDYLIVEADYRTKGIMSQIYKLANQKIDETGCKSIVLECGDEMPQHDAIVRLYKIFGFKKFDFNYKEPKVDVHPTISWEELPSTLMYKNLNIGYIEVLKTIYFDHYMRWYSLYQLPCLDYAAFLGNLINKTLHREGKSDVLMKLEKSLEDEHHLITEAIGDIISIVKMNDYETAIELIRTQFLVIDRQDLKNEEKSDNFTDNDVVEFANKIRDGVNKMLPEHLQIKKNINLKK